MQRTSVLSGRIRSMLLKRKKKEKVKEKEKKALGRDPGEKLEEGEGEEMQGEMARRWRSTGWRK